MEVEEEEADLGGGIPGRGGGIPGRDGDHRPRSRSRGRYDDRWRDGGRDRGRDYGPQRGQGRGSDHGYYRDRDRSRDHDRGPWYGYYPDVDHLERAQDRGESSSDRGWERDGGGIPDVNQQLQQLLRRLDAHRERRPEFREDYPRRDRPEH